MHSQQSHWTWTTQINLVIGLHAPNQSTSIDWAQLLAHILQQLFGLVLLHLVIALVYTHLPTCKTLCGPTACLVTWQQYIATQQTPFAAWRCICCCTSSLYIGTNSNCPKFIAHVQREFKLIKICSITWVHMDLTHTTV